MTTGRSNESNPHDAKPTASAFSWTADDLRDPLMDPAPVLSSPQNWTSTAFLPPAGEAEAPLTSVLSADPSAGVPMRRQRSGRLAIISLAAASVGAVGTGAALWSALNSIKPDLANPVGNAVLWLSVSAVMALLVFVSLIMAVVAMVQKGRWPLAILAVAVALLITPVAVTVGVAQGLSAVKNRVAADVERGTGQSASQLVKTLEDRGVNLGPLDNWLRDTGNPVP